MLCALNSDTVTVTYAEDLEYIDYRTFNLITYSMYSVWLQGCIYSEWVFLGQVFPH